MGMLEIMDIESMSEKSMREWLRIYVNMNAWLQIQIYDAQMENKLLSEKYKKLKKLPDK